MLVALDFDNTLIEYDHVFYGLARERGLVPDGLEPLKSAVRDHVRSRYDDLAWHGLQAQVYGPLIHRGRMMAGAREFVRLCRDRRVDLVVVSHKSKFASHVDQLPSAESIDLRAAALGWMRANGFFLSMAEGGLNFSPNDIHFESTRQAKVERINALGCDVLVDDLSEVLTHKDLRADLERVWFNRQGQCSEDFHCCGGWAGITDYFFARLPSLTGLFPHSEAEEDGFSGARLLTGGRNSRVFRLDYRDGRSFVLKEYFRHPGDKRDRLDTEAKALRFLETAGEPDVPRLVAVDQEQGLGLLTFVPGHPVERGDPSAVGQVAEFFLRLQGYAKQLPGEADLLPKASEAFFRADHVAEHVRERLTRLETASIQGPQGKGLGQLIQDKLLPSLDRMTDRCARILNCHGLAMGQELPLQARILSPSDFGTHNALRRKDGTVCFLDLEYFGWDDPAKTLADFVLHPAMGLTPHGYAPFIRRILPELDSGTRPRLEALFPLFGLKWCCIFLNEFIVLDRDRRHFAQGLAVGEDVLDRQLGLARELHDSLDAKLKALVDCLEGVPGPTQ